jgi:hypothetical protein
MNRRRARRVTFRVRKAMFTLVCDIADGMGSTLAELCQVMILTGSIFEYVPFENAAHLGEFVSAARMNKSADGVDEENPLRETLISLAHTKSLIVSGPGRNRPHIEGSELMKVRLPPGFVNKIDLYAKLTKATRSAILTRFFEKGLLLYMRSQRALMTAIVEAMHSKEHESTDDGTD